MSNTSDNSQVAGSVLAEVPPLRSVEYAADAVGNVRTSVNQFRGAVSLPIDLLTLPGKEGLDVKLTILYSSIVRTAVEGWNVEAPTGVLGLGWNMPYEFIMVEKNGSGSDSSDTYYWVSGGAASPMVKTGSQGTQWRFELRNYEFWDILYDPSRLIWTITRENGYVYSYGGDKAAIRWGVKWGNWIGDSAMRAGQQQYPLAWNLVSVQSPWGEAVSYAYQNVMACVGQSGLEYTQASYLKTVTDSFGRVLTFNYNKKFGASNPSPQGIVEYQARHANPPTPNAYQDTFETLYLDNVEVADSTGTFFYRYRFTYGFANFANSGTLGYPLFWKRQLLGVYREGANGEVHPGMSFRYNAAAETNPGALNTVIYPDGAVACYAYKKTSIQAPKSVRVPNPLPGASPGVWHGVNYVAFTYCGVPAGFKIIVYSWDGQWISADITAKQMAGIQADPDSVMVFAAESSLTLSLRNKLYNRDEVYIYRRNNSAFGEWVLYNQEPIYLALKSTAASATSFAAGVDFVVAYNPGYVDKAFHSFCYDWKSGLWTSPANLPQYADGNATGVAIAGSQNYFIVATYVQSMRQVKFQIFYRNLDGAWINTNPWTVGNFDIVVDSGQLLFGWTLQPTCAIATYVTSGTADAINYTVGVFQWDENFLVRNASQPKSIKLSSPIVGGMSQYKVFQTIAADALINNNIANLRNVGGDIGTGGSANWIERAFDTSAGSAKLGFAAAADIAIMCSENQGRQTNAALAFNPNHPDATGWSYLSGLVQEGTHPSASAEYFTVGDRVYFLGTDGQWSPLAVRLNNLGEPASIQNRSPFYIAYQDSTGANTQTYVTFVQNGQISIPEVLPGGPQKVFIPSGQAGERFSSSLAGSQFLVSYPASAASFLQADSFGLHNLSEQNLDEYVFDYPVAYVEIQNQYDPAQDFTQSFFYGNSDQSKIAYNSVTGIAQYPMVQVLAGVKSNGMSPPQIQPQGRSIFYYSNGLSPQSIYAQSWICNYQDVLNGIQLAQQDFDSAGKLVFSQTNYWQVFTRNATTGNNLFGAYVRLARFTTIIDGVSQETVNTYDSTTGVQLRQDVSYNDALGDSAKTLRTERRYAWQEPAYRDTFLNRHLYTAVVETTTSVWQSGNLASYVQSEVTTYRNWASVDAGIACADPRQCKLGEYQTYQWRTPGTNPPSFDFSTAGEQAGWLKVMEIESRTPSGVSPVDSLGLVSEQRDVNGVPSSFIYDRAQRYAVAAFPNGSLAGDEVSYSGFEDYEADSGWTLGSGAGIVPNDANTAVDAHTGSRSLRLAPGSLGAGGISRIFTPARQNQSYVFSAWVKKPEGFDAGKGNACWLIAVDGGAPLTVNFPPDVGTWIYVSQVIEPSSGGNGLLNSIAITGQNANVELHVLIDDVRFSPLACQFQATVYDSRYWTASAQLGANGECRRTAYDGFQQPVATTTATDRLEKITSAYFSRSGNQGAFASGDPNCSLLIKAAVDGQLVDFKRGQEWQQTWVPQSDVWQVVDGRLRQAGPDQAGQLALGNPNYRSDYALSIDFVPLQAVTQSLGLRLGVDFEVRWNSTALQWELIDGQGRNLASPVSMSLFSVPADPYAGQLDDKLVSADLQNLFGLGGYPLPTGSMVVSGSSAEGKWVLAGPGGAYYYYLLRLGDKLSVRQLGGTWTAVLQASRFIFWVNGQQIFNLGISGSFSDAPTWFFGSQVSITRLVSALGPQASVSFTDATGVPIQAQAWVDGRALASQIIPDNKGRQAVRSKSIFVEAVAHPPLAYCADLARLDWSSGLMAGRVNDAYPADAGYPYSREVYEASPQDRVVERGMPGADFRIGAHSTRIAYGATDGKFGFPANRFYQTTIVNPNGDVFYEISNQLKQVISKLSENGGTVVQNMTVFDDAGNPGELRSPNFFNPPAGSTAANWTTIQSFDYAGRITSMQSGDPNGVVTRYLYDRAGNLRFIQDPQGAVDGRINYWKYDVLNQPIEEGYVAGNWDSGALQDKADTDPGWPPTPATWRRKSAYNGNQQAPHCIGRVHQIQSNNGDDGNADVVETYEYAVSGVTTGVSLLATGFDTATEYRVDYVYDNLGNTVQITYPETSVGQRYVVRYRLNQLNQVNSIYSPEGGDIPIASYQYGPNGQISRETMALPGGQSVDIGVGYNPALWVNSIVAANQAGSSLFKETLRYTEGGFNSAEPGYYNGMIAAADYQSAGDPARSFDFKYSVDANGQIGNAQSSAHPDWNLGVVKPLAYDANGNFTEAFQGGVDRSYVYFPGTQKLQKIVQAGTSAGVLAEFGYDQNGNATSFHNAGSNQLTLEYDPGTKMTRRISDGAADGATLAFTYGGNNQRVLKQVERSGGAPSKTLYVRGINPYPLCELTIADRAEAAVPVIYLYGPSGLMAMRKRDALFRVLKDHLGSVRAVVDAQAQIVASYDYLTFGALASIVEPEPGFMPYLFTGQEYDREIALYNYRSRFFAANIGRFIAVDPGRQYFSPYLYCGNNPVLLIDPTGNLATWARILLGAALVVVAIGVVVLTVATAGTIAPAVAAAVGPAATSVAAFFGAGVATAGTVGTAIGTGVGVVAAVGYSAAMGAVSGAAFGGGLYSWGTSNEAFSWRDFGQQVALGAITGAIAGGIAQGLSMAGQGIATAVTGLTEEAAAKVAAKGWTEFGKFAARNVGVGLVSKGIAGAVSTGTGNAVSNIWGQTHMDPNDMAVSILLGGLLWGATKGAGGGGGSAAWSAGKNAVSNMLARSFSFF
jgi:RHS repeat-associated protein